MLSHDAIEEPSRKASVSNIRLLNPKSLPRFCFFRGSAFDFGGSSSEWRARPQLSEGFLSIPQNMHLTELFHPMDASDSGGLPSLQEIQVVKYRMLHSRAAGSPDDDPGRRRW
jgi:hypothetical protein